MPRSPTQNLWRASDLRTLLPSQHARLLKLFWAQDTQAPELLVERMAGHEGVNALFAFDIDTLCVDARFNPATLIGRELTLQLLQADGGYRSWHGMLAGCDALGSDGGLARHRLYLRPWLAALALRRGSHVWGHQTLPDILADLFADYPNAHYVIDARQHAEQGWKPYPTRVQYHESDLDFVLRLLADEGLSLRFEHLQSSDASASDPPPCPSRHRLIIFDTGSELPVDPQSPIRFHRIDATETKDSIMHLQAVRHAVTHAATVSSWDHARLHAPAAHARSALALGQLPPLEQHLATSAQRFRNSEEAQAHAEHWLHHWQAQAKRWRGEGSVRQLSAAQSFTVSEHPRYGEDSRNAGRDADGSRIALRPVQIWHQAANNLGASIAQLLQSPDIEAGSYRNRFEALDAQAAVVPPPRTKPSAPEALLALVVGTQDNASPHAVHTQRDHRVQVRFYWQPQNQPDTASAANTAQATASRRRNHVPSVWLRVATPMAGPNWGVIALPRVGTEVLLSFIDGDIDRPIVSQQLHCAQGLPPWSAGVDGAGNHPASISGWHSTSLDGSGHNQWLADDAPAQVRSRVASSQASSQLNLGHLIDHAPDSSTRGAWRGTGAELRSDAWTVVRAGEGLLISSSAQPRAAGTLHDATAAVGQFQAAHDTAQRISDAVAASQGLALKATEALQAFIDDLDAQAKGKLPPSLNGQDATIAAAGQRQGTQAVPGFARPALVLDAANSLNAATPASAVLYGGQCLHWTSQQDWHAAAGRTIAMAAGRSAGLYAQAGGLKAVAQAGPVSIQAHQGPLQWKAQDKITVTSSGEDVQLLAQGKITLAAGQVSIELDGSHITLTMPATLDIKGSTKSFVGPASSPAQLPALPVGNVTIEPPRISPPPHTFNFSA